MNLLFVCTGNTCRSPLAEVIARAEATARGESELDCRSAGAFAAPGRPAADPGISVASEHGLNLERHASRELTHELAEWADLVIGMDHAHVEAAAAINGSTPVHLMSDFLPPNHALHGRGIPDPIGGDRARYAQTYDVLALAIRGLFDALRDRTEASESEPK